MPMTPATPGAFVRRDNPCIKGTIFKPVASEIAVMLADGRIDRDDLRAHLKPDDEIFLKRETAISNWYPIDIYERLARLLAAVQGDGRAEFSIEAGHRSAERVGELGIYSQLDERTRETWADETGRILITLAGSFFNFGHWEWLGLEGDGFEVEVTEAASMPEIVVLGTQGFIEYLACRAAGGAVAVTHQRSPDGDRIRFRAHRVG
jgi:hypothetical protein